LRGTQEVGGSIAPSSTKKYLKEINNVQSRNARCN
jgi:hypothetical protein